LAWVRRWRLAHLASRSPPRARMAVTRLSITPRRSTLNRLVKPHVVSTANASFTDGRFTGRVAWLSAMWCVTTDRITCGQPLWLCLWPPLAQKGRDTIERCSDVPPSFVSADECLVSN
jgi:hypothetical protein